MLLDQRHAGDRAVAPDRRARSSSFAADAARPRVARPPRRAALGAPLHRVAGRLRDRRRRCRRRRTVMLRPGRLARRPRTVLFWAAVALVVAWPTLLGATGAYSERVFGTGSDEYRRVGRAGFLLLARRQLPVLRGRPGPQPRSFVVVAVPALDRWSRCSAATPPAVRLRRRRTPGPVHQAGRRRRPRRRRPRTGRPHCSASATPAWNVVAACVTPADRARVAEEAGRAGRAAWTTSSPLGRRGGRRRHRGDLGQRDRRPVPPPAVLAARGHAASSCSSPRA